MKEYEVKVTYTGYVHVMAESESEAIAKGADRWGDEVGYDIKESSEYEIEGEICDECGEEHDNEL